MDSDSLAAPARWLPAFGLAALLAGCASAPPTVPAPPPAPARAPVSAPSSPPPISALPPQAVAPAPTPVARASVAASPPHPAPERAPAPPLAAEALALADRMRALSNNDLAAEIARLSGPGTTPLNQLTLALALLQFPAPAEGQRVAALLQGIITNGSDDARPLHPLARQVASQHAQQRRLEEQLERQAQQLREAQRRIDQLSERLEALRAIERSMPSRAR